MIQEIRQCVFILKNFERNIEELLAKCDEVRKQHIQDNETIQKLSLQIEKLQGELKEKQKNEESGVNGETEEDTK